jgi:hypothetical protein
MPTIRDMTVNVQLKPEYRNTSSLNVMIDVSVVVVARLSTPVCWVCGAREARTSYLLPETLVVSHFSLLSVLRLTSLAAEDANNHSIEKFDGSRSPRREHP